MNSFRELLPEIRKLDLFCEGRRFKTWGDTRQQKAQSINQTWPEGPNIKFLGEMSWWAQIGEGLEIYQEETL
jgi:hypothetical protein